MSSNSLPRPPAIGTIIDNGTLELVNILDRGGYGIVYRADDLHSPTRLSYAVKCLLHTPTENAGHQRRLRMQEIALHQLASAHPNVITLHRVIEEEDCTFIVMDHCPDGDLSGHILKRRRYLGRDGLIKHVFLQLLEAVDYCHSLGIYHRNLKPKNVLCFNGGVRLAITDFGLATTEKVSEEFRIGSVQHMSPECQGGSFAPSGTYSTPSNDIWSLGIFLVNLITGRNPWKSASPSDPTFQVYRNDPANFLPSFLPISAEVNEVLIRILDIDWRNRISIAELRRAIKGVTTFYADDVVFEGNKARFSWDADIDITGGSRPKDDGSSWVPYPAGSSSNSMYSPTLSGPYVPTMAVDEDPTHVDGSARLEPESDLVNVSPIDFSPTEQETMSGHLPANGKWPDFYGVPPPRPRPQATHDTPVAPFPFVPLKSPFEPTTPFRAPSSQAHARPGRFVFPTRYPSSSPSVPAGSAPAPPNPFPKIGPINHENFQLRPYSSSTTLQSNGSIYNASFRTTPSDTSSFITVMSNDTLNEKTTPLVQELSVGYPTHGIATSEDMGQPASPQSTWASTNGPPSQHMGVNDKPRWVPQEDDDNESSTEHLATPVAPDTSSEGTVTRWEHEHFADLELQLSEKLFAQSERERHIALLTDQISTLLEQAEADSVDAAEAKKPEQRDLQAFLLQSRDEALEQARGALQIVSRAAEANELSRRELTQIRAELDARKSESAAFRSRLTDLENGAGGYRNQTATGDLDQVIHVIAERIRALQAGPTSRQWNEKWMADMEAGLTSRHWNEKRSPQGNKKWIADMENRNE